MRQPDIAMGPAAELAIAPATVATTAAAAAADGEEEEDWGISPVAPAATGAAARANDVPLPRVYITRVGGVEYAACTPEAAAAAAAAAAGQGLPGGYEPDATSPHVGDSHRDLVRPAEREAAVVAAHASAAQRVPALAAARAAFVSAMYIAAGRRAP
ncbi:hypothetical protein MMPV_007883 [Pyropia vietnamensis]